MKFPVECFVLGLAAVSVAFASTSVAVAAPLAMTPVIQSSPAVTAAAPETPVISGQAQLEALKPQAPLRLVDKQEFCKKLAQSFANIGASSGFDRVHTALLGNGAAVQVVETTDRAAVGELITMKEFVDVIVPRGGKGLIERISNDARIPVIKHLDGNCHVYVDDEADFDKAIRIIENSKTQRLGTCNTTESLLVARSVAKSMLPKIAEMLISKGIEIRGCAETCALVPAAKKATEEDYYTEYLDAIISCKVVADLDEAIAHINQHSSQHTEAIVTENYTKARRFLREVDSSSVMVNASTRFADGFEYGLGAEIGI